MKLEPGTLAHRYDPVKAHEYYMRNRKLKGRVRGRSQPSRSGRSRSGGGTSNAGMRPSRRKELLAQRDALEKRLDTLRDILAEKVRIAKARSGVKTPPKKKAASAEKDKGKATKDRKPDKPLTAKEKAEKRKASKEQYEKEKGMSLSTEVEHLQAQIRDIRAKIDKAVADARRKSSMSKPQTASKGR